MHVNDSSYVSSLQESIPCCSYEEDESPPHSYMVMPSSYPAPPASAYQPLPPIIPPTLPDGRPRWVHYHLQRFQTTANHVLFYLVGADYQATLAVVGTDVRFSGHFVYASLPDLKAGPPLRCTNRTRVMEWLAALGAREAADPARVMLPKIDQPRLQMLASSDPMYSMPELDREYTSWREESGRFPDDRHFKNYYLVDENTGEDRLVVTAEDSHRKDRRYNYKAVPELGGFAFENGTAVKDWLDFIVGRLPPQLPIPPVEVIPAAPASKPGSRAKRGSKAKRKLSGGVSWSSDVRAPAPATSSPVLALKAPQSTHTFNISATAGGAASTSLGPPVLAPTNSGGQSGALSSGADLAVDPYNGPEVYAAFSSNPPLMHWITSVPDTRLVEQLKEWGTWLSQKVSLPPMPPQDPYMDAAPFKAPAGEACEAAAVTLAARSAQVALSAPMQEQPQGDSFASADVDKVLKALTTMPMTLRLIMESQIMHHILALKRHSDTDIAEAALKLTNKWRTVVEQALNVIHQNEHGQRHVTRPF